LEELAPGIRIVAVIVSPDNAFTTVALPQLRIAASARDLRLEICEVRTADQLPASIKAAVKAGATGLTILETPILYGLRRQIADLAAELRLFAIYTSRDFVDAGGLISYAADRRQQSIILLPGPLHRAQTIDAGGCHPNARQSGIYRTTSSATAAHPAQKAAIALN